MGFRMSGAARRRGDAPRRRLRKRGRLQFPWPTRLETKVTQLLGKVNPVQSTVVGRGGCGGGGHGCYRNGRVDEGGHGVPPPARVLHHLLADSRGWVGEEGGNGRDGRHVDAGAGARRGEARGGAGKGRVRRRDPAEADAGAGHRGAAAAAAAGSGLLAETAAEGPCRGRSQDRPRCRAQLRRGGCTSQSAASSWERKRRREMDNGYVLHPALCWHRRIPWLVL